MANEYIPIEWQDNISTPLSADNLNRMEQGIQLANDKATEAVNTADTANTTANTVKSGLEDVVEDINKKFTKDSIKGLIDDEYVTPEQLQQALDAKPDTDTNTTYTFEKGDTAGSIVITPSSGDTLTVDTGVTEYVDDKLEGLTPFTIADNSALELTNKKLLLNLNNSGNVQLSQTSDGLRADVDTSIFQPGGTIDFPGVMYDHGELPNETDFDTVTESGYYFIHAGNKHSNCPTDDGGMLIVYQDVLNQQLKSRLYQIMIVGRVNTCCIRSRLTDGTFTAWTNYNGGALTDGTDLDTVTTPGVYWLSSAANYLNAPSKVGGILHVYDDTSNSLPTRLYQQLIDGDSLATYTRVRRYGSGESSMVWGLDTGLYTKTGADTYERVKTWGDLVGNSTTPYISYEISGNTARIRVDYDVLQYDWAQWDDDVLQSAVLRLPDFTNNKHVDGFENVTSYSLEIQGAESCVPGILSFPIEGCSSIKFITTCVDINATFPTLYARGQSINLNRIVVEDSTNLKLSTFAIENKYISVYTYDGSIINGVQTIVTKYSDWVKNITSTEIQNHSTLDEVMLSDDYLETYSPYTNLWNGNWYFGARLNGEIHDPVIKDQDGLRFVFNQDFNSTAVIPVKGNTVYSCVLEHTEAEPYYEYNNKGDYYYFKIATASKKLASGDYFGAAQYQWMSASTAVKSHTFKTPADAKYVYIQTSRALQIPFILVEGVTNAYSTCPPLQRLSNKVSPDDTTNSEYILRNTPETIGQVTDTNTLYGDFEVETTFRKTPRKAVVGKAWIDNISEILKPIEYTTYKKSLSGALNTASSCYSVANTGNLKSLKLSRGTSYCILIEPMVQESGIYRFKCALGKSSEPTRTTYSDSTFKTNITNSYTIVTTGDTLQCWVTCSSDGKVNLQYFYKIPGINKLFDFTPVQYDTNTSLLDDRSSEDIYLYMDVGMSNTRNIHVFEYAEALKNITGQAQLKGNLDFTYTTVTNSNIFDGTYYNLDISGKTIKYNSGKSSTAIIKVKPNHFYSIFVELYGKEIQANALNYVNYFRIVAAEKLHSFIASTSANITGNSNLDVISTHGHVVPKVIFQVPDGCEYLYIMSSSGLQPLMQVIEGTESDEDIDAKFMTDIGIDSYDLGSNKLTVHKWIDISPRSTGSNTIMSDKFIVKDGRSIHTFICDTAASANLDKTWRWYNDKIDGTTLHDSTDNNTNVSVQHNTTTLWQGTDCEGPIRRIHADDFTGGFHGDEKYAELLTSKLGHQVAKCDIFVDGKYYAADNLFIEHDVSDVEFRAISNVLYETAPRNYDSAVIKDDNSSYVDATYIVGKKQLSIETNDQGIPVLDISFNSGYLSNTGTTFSDLVNNGYEFYSTTTKVKGRTASSYVINTFDIYDVSTDQLVLKKSDLTLAELVNETAYLDITSSKISPKENISLIGAQGTTKHISGHSMVLNGNISLKTGFDHCYRGSINKLDLESLVDKLVLFKIGNIEYQDRIKSFTNNNETIYYVGDMAYLSSSTYNSLDYFIQFYETSVEIRIPNTSSYYGNESLSIVIMSVKCENYQEIPKYNKDSDRAYCIRSIELKPKATDNLNSYKTDNKRDYIRFNLEVRLHTDSVIDYSIREYAGFIREKDYTSSSSSGYMYDIGPNKLYYYYESSGDYIYNFLFNSYDDPNVFISTQHVDAKACCVPVVVNRINNDGTISPIQPKDLQEGDDIIYDGVLRTVLRKSIDTDSVINNVRTKSGTTSNNLWKITLTPSRVAFKRYKNITFQPGKIRVRNTWQYLGTKNYELDISAMSGIYSVWRNKLNGAKDNFHGAILPIPTEASKELTPMDSRFQGKYVDEVIMFGKDDFTTKIRSLGNKGRYYAGHISKMSSERYKAYLWDIDLEHGGKRRK